MKPVWFHISSGNSWWLHASFHVLEFLNLHPDLFPLRSSAFALGLWTLHPCFSGMAQCSSPWPSLGPPRICPPGLDSEVCYAKASLTCSKSTLVSVSSLKTVLCAGAEAGDAVVEISSRSSADISPMSLSSCVSRSAGLFCFLPSG